MVTSNQRTPRGPQEKWQGAGSRRITTRAGQLHSEASDLTEHDTGVAMATYAGPEGYTAAVEHREPAMGGTDYTQYEAGPFKTPVRAQIASESLSRRITYRGGAEHYRTGTDFMSYRDQAYDGP